MSREGQTILFVGAEAQAWTTFDREREAFDQRWAEVYERHRDNEETRGDLTCMAELLNTILNEHSIFLHARLTRAFPHLADVIAYLLFSEFMQTPEWLDQAGMPLAYVLPPQRRTESE